MAFAVTCAALIGLWLPNKNSFRRPINAYMRQPIHRHHGHRHNRNTTSTYCYRFLNNNMPLFIMFALVKWLLIFLRLCRRHACQTAAPTTATTKSTKKKKKFARIIRICFMRKRANGRTKRSFVFERFFFYSITGKIIVSLFATILVCFLFASAIFRFLPRVSVFTILQLHRCVVVDVVARLNVSSCFNNRWYRILCRLLSLRIRPIAELSTTMCWRAIIARHCKPQDNNTLRNKPTDYVRVCFFLFFSILFLPFCYRRRSHAVCNSYNFWYINCNIATGWSFRLTEDKFMQSFIISFLSFAVVVFLLLSIWNVSTDRGSYR